MAHKVPSPNGSDDSFGARTQPKSVRATPAELARIGALLPSMPAADSESGALRILMLDGLVMREAAVLAAGGELPPGISRPQLLAALAAQVLPVLPLLAHMLPQLASAPPSDQARPAPVPARPHDAIDDSAAADVGDMGGALL